MGPLKLGIFRLQNCELNEPLTLIKYPASGIFVIAAERGLRQNPTAVCAPEGAEQILHRASTLSAAAEPGNEGMFKNQLGCNVLRFLYVSEAVTFVHVVVWILNVPQRSMG